MVSGAGELARTVDFLIIRHAPREKLGTLPAAQEAANQLKVDNAGCCEMHGLICGSSGDQLAASGAVGKLMQEDCLLQAAGS